MLSAVLTHTTQALFAQSDQHIQAQIAISGLIEMLQTPHMNSIFFQCIIDAQ